MLGQVPLCGKAYFVAINCKYLPVFKVKQFPEDFIALVASNLLALG